MIGPEGLSGLHPQQVISAPQNPERLEVRPQAGGSASAPPAAETSQPGSTGIRNGGPASR